MLDRFTKDEVSAKVWWPFALLLVVLLVLSFPLHNALVRGEREQATADAAVLVRQIVAPALAGIDLSRPLGAEQVDLLRAGFDRAIAGSSVITVRLWSEDGTLRLSTDPTDAVGSDAGLNDHVLSQATSAGGAPLTSQSERTITGEPADPRQLVYVAVGDTADSVAQVDIDDGALLGALGDRWSEIQLALLGGTLVVLLLAGLSVREPIAPIGANVKFYPASVPANLAVVSREEATRMRHADQHARDRINAMQSRLAELEATKYTLEGDLQRALSALASRGERPSTVIARAPAAPAAAAPPASPVPAIEVPAPVMAPAPTPKRRAPVVAADAVTVVVPSKDTEAPARSAEPIPAAAIQPERIVELPESEVVAIPSPVAAPVPSPVAAPVAAGVNDDGRDAQVIDVLERLVDPAGGQTLHPELDPSEIRIRLAKTAASKKPGSRAERERFPKNPD